MSEQSIYDRPRTRQPCPPYSVAKRNTKQTLRELMTENETKTWRLTLLKEMSTRPKGGWKEMHDFYVANQSGDTDSFKPEGKAMISKILKALDLENSKRQKGDDDAV